MCSVSSDLTAPEVWSKCPVHAARCPTGVPEGNEISRRQARPRLLAESRPLQHRDHRPAPDRTIRGSEQITYFNNSPDTLRNPVIKLLLNIHKPGAPRGGGASADYLTSGVHIDSLVVNGQVTPWPGDDNTFTWERLKLAAPLLPHDSVHLSFKWHFDISKESGRTSHPFLTSASAMSERWQRHGTASAHMMAVSLKLAIFVSASKPSENSGVAM